MRDGVIRTSKNLKRSKMSVRGRTFGDHTNQSTSKLFMTSLPVFPVGPLMLYAD